MRVCNMHVAKFKQNCKNVPRSPFHVLLSFPFVLLIRLISCKSRKCGQDDEMLMISHEFLPNWAKTIACVDSDAIRWDLLFYIKWAKSDSCLSKTIYSYMSDEPQIMLGVEFLVSRMRSRRAYGAASWGRVSCTFSAEGVRILDENRWVWDSADGVPG